MRICGWYSMKVPCSQDTLLKIAPLFSAESPMSVALTTTYEKRSFQRSIFSRGYKLTSLWGVPCPITAQASAPQGPWCVRCVWLQQGVRKAIAWSKAIDFEVLSRGSVRKKARNLIETAQRKSQLVFPTHPDA
jgi:hypothetical protein